MQKNALGFKAWGLQQGPKNKGKKKGSSAPQGGWPQWCEKVVVLICKIFEVRCKRMH